MHQAIDSPYGEFLDGGYYVKGTRVSLPSVIHGCRGGATAEAIFQSFPLVGAVSKVYGAIAFILENPGIVEDYLSDQDRLWTELEAKHPTPSDMVNRFKEGQKMLRHQPA